MKLLKWGGLLSIALYMLVVYAIYLGQRNFLYFPNPERPSLVAAAVSAEEITYTTPDGETIYAWYAPSDRDDAKTILLLHGNGGNLNNYAFMMQTFRKAGFGLLAVSYRGYGGSSGTPTEPGLVMDGLAGFDWLTVHGHQAENIIIYGRSLGSGVATQIAAKRQAQALVLESPYSAIVDIAAANMPLIPVRYLMKDQFRSTEYIAKVGEPVLILHGTQDQVVPYKFGLKLYNTASEPKKLITYENGTHFNLHQIGAGIDVVTWMNDVGG